MSEETNANMLSWASTILKEVGFPVAVAVFLLFLVNQQGTEMANRLERLNDYVMIELQGLVKTSTEANVRSTEALVRSTQAIEQNSDALTQMADAIERQQ